RKAIEVNPKTLVTYNNLGNALSKKGDIDGAIAAYRTAIARDPQHLRALRNLGVSLCKAEDVTAGIRTFRSSLELRPDDPEVFYCIACAHLSVGQLDAHHQVCADMMNRFEKNRNDYWADRILYA